MSNTETIQKLTPKKRSQIIAFRLPVEIYQEYEQKCLELQQPMTNLLRQTVNEFLDSLKGDLNN